MTKALAPSLSPRPCGCVWYSGEPEPAFPCRDASALQAAARFAEMLAATMPGDRLCARLVTITETALGRHYGREAAADPPRRISPPGSEAERSIPRYSAEEETRPAA